MAAFPLCRTELPAGTLDRLVGPCRTSEAAFALEGANSSDDNRIFLLSIRTMFRNLNIFEVPGLGWHGGRLQVPSKSRISNAFSLNGTRRHRLRPSLVTRGSASDGDRLSGPHEALQRQFVLKMLRLELAVLNHKLP